MYADDLILMSPLVTIFQKLFQIAEEELMSIEMSINPSKSSCIRFGPRYDAICADIMTHDGSIIHQVKSCKYLGICCRRDYLNVFLTTLRNRFINSLMQSLVR